MKTPRTTATALAGTALALSLGACSSPAPTASSPSSPPKPPVSAAACTAALERAGLDTVVQGAAHGGKYPADVNKACNGLPAGAMKSAVNEAMTFLVNGGTATP